ncbi:MAG TPA: SUMF1/EgtB/PvdO family nonheme iron enzyme [Pyrinomonadaceae bacterium]|nr:SUMF1/EgtB/PvdO family nonheme iron enzyme [Pyrinomonadaceae bacterium]
MICPECGKETSNAQAFCRQCGAFVRSQFGKVLPTGPLRPIRAATTGPLVARVERDSLAQLDWAEIEALLLAEDDEWPADESVFVPNEEDETQSPPEFAGEDFEDAQADDLIEQSLSGQIKREDVLAELDEIEEEQSIHETKPADVSEQITIAPSPDEQFLKTNPEMFAGIEPVRAQEIAVTSELSPNRRWLATVAMFLVPLVFFAVGLAVGIRSNGYVNAPLPTESDVPPVLSEVARPIAPTGMAYVPGGDFLMGSDEGDTISKPPHFTSVAPFFMDTTEVTNQQYAEFLSATGEVAPPSWKDGVYPESEANFPVTGVTWYEAAEYAAWKGERLPTEAEWEFAARGPEGRVYPWGDEWDATLANAGGQLKGLRPVGQGGASPFGIYDMSGNAWEWTSSDARSYPGGKEFPWSRMRLKIIRGGNWQSDPRSATTYFRGFYGAAGEREYNGTSFRCVKDIPK